MQLDTMLTLDEYARLPHPGSHRVELSRGLLVRQPHPSPLHAMAAVRVYDGLRAYAARAGGRAVLDTAFMLQEEPPTIRAPDVAFVGAKQSAEPAVGRIVRGAPLLAVEITAATVDGARAEIIEKAFEYLEAGASAVWIVDLASRFIATYENGAEPRIYRRRDIIDCSALPGLACAVASVFG